MQNESSSFLIAQAAQATGQGTTTTPKAVTQATTKPAEQPQAASGGLSQFSTLLMPLLLIVFFYFLLIRPQNKKEKLRQKMLKGIQKNDRVLTRGGMYGVVVGTKPEENIAIVKIADNVKVEVAISMIETVLNNNPVPEK